MIQYTTYKDGPHTFEFDGAGNLTVTLKHAPDNFSTHKYTPADSKPKTFAHFAQTYANAAEVGAAITKHAPEGWAVCAGWVVPSSPPMIQIVFKKEVP